MSGAADRDVNHELVFAEPWQAEAFATKVALVEGEIVSEVEWTAALGLAIASEPGADYYDAWVRALASVCADKHLVDGDALATREDAWREAYFNTPHGSPVELANLVPTEPNE